MINDRKLKGVNKMDTIAEIILFCVICVPVILGSIVLSKTFIQMLIPKRKNKKEKNNNENNND